MKALKVLLKGLMVLISCVLLGAGCTKSAQHKSPEEQIMRLITEMENYETIAEITFTKNKKRSTIEVQQTYDKEGRYTLTILSPESIKGYQTVYDGEKITEYNPINDKSVQGTVSPVKNEVLFGTFVHNYLESENRTIVEEETLNQMILQTSIPGSYKYMAKESVWFDQVTGVPTQMIIYGEDDTETITIRFDAFKYTMPTK